MKNKLFLCLLMFVGTQAISKLSAAGCQAGFTFSANNNVVTFTNTSKGLKKGSKPNYYWSFGDGSYGYTSNAIHTYSYNGTYNVCLTIIDSLQNCYSTFCDKVTVTGGAIPSCNVNITGNTNIVAGNSTWLSASFMPACSGTAYSWSTGATTASIVVAPNVTTTYWVYAYCPGSNCSDSSAVTVYVQPSSSCHASFTYYVSGNTVTVNNTSTGNYTSANWEFGDGTGWITATTNPFSHTYSQPGYYHITLGLADSSGLWYGCDSMGITVLVGGSSSCHASFTYSISGNIVSFVNTSTGGSSPNYTWSFGDNTYGYNVNATHTYASNGYYMVCLTMYDSLQNCQSYYCDSLVITGGNNPSCNITITGNTNIVAGNTTVLSAYLAPYCSGAIYNWSTGATTASITVAPAVTTTYWVYSYCPGTNCGDSAAVTVYVQPSSGCHANFTYSISGNVVSFVNTSTGASSPNYTWSFGDNTYSYNVNATHTYASNGYYMVCLTMYDSLQNCYSYYCDSLMITGGVNPCNLATYIYSTSATCSTCNDGSATAYVYGGTPPYVYSWSPNGATTATAAGLMPGTYHVIVTDANGCVDTAAVVLGVACNLQGGFTYTYGTGGTVNFTSTSSGAVSPWYYWWGSQNFSQPYQATTSQTFPNGTHQVCLSYQDLTNPGDSSCNVVYCDMITVTGAANPPCNASIYLVQDSSNINPLVWYVYPAVTGTAPFTYLWNFGDGTTSTQAYPTHTYSTPGTYVICLTITDATGCTSTSCDSTYKVAATGLVQQLVVVNPASTGIEENTVSVNSVFPNPANDMIEVSLSQFVQGELRITDVTGREVYGEKINSDNVKVNVSALPVGYYNLSVLSGAKTTHTKMMIVR